MSRDPFAGAGAHGLKQPGSGDFSFAPGQVLGLLGEPAEAVRFCRDWGLEPCTGARRFRGLRGELGGFAELIVTPRSGVAGRTVREIGVRRRFRVEPLVLVSGGEAYRGDLSDRVLRPGAALVAASNSFVLPTHQVNALLMGPGGYRNADYLRAGGGVTVLFLLVATLGVWFLYA